MGESGGTPLADVSDAVEGSIDQLPSGSLRVRVYSCRDVLTSKKLYLTEVIKAGTYAQSLAEAARQRMVQQVVDGRFARTNSTVDQLVSKHLRNLDIQESSLAVLEGYHRNHVRPLLGHRRTNTLDAETIESFYAELRRCREHCSGPFVRHYTDQDHRCSRRCVAHTCVPLAKRTILKIHYLLTAAYASGRVWEWTLADPFARVRKPTAPPPVPMPPTASEAARLLAAAWVAQSAYLGVMVWLAMTTGARRGELCALQWRHFQIRHQVFGDHECAEEGCYPVLEIFAAVEQNGARIGIKSTKTHQRRHVTLDSVTASLLDDLRDQQRDEARLLGRKLADEHFILSLSPASDEPVKPRTASQAYARIAEREGIQTSLHKLRHYAATELIAAGVDIRTVAGRLGHGGGGVTTLKVYTAWVAEADQRAARQVTPRLPAIPDQRHKTNPRQLAPWQRIAQALRESIEDGTRPPGAELPSVKDLAATYGVAPSTAQRAVENLAANGLVHAHSGRRTTVAMLPGRSGSVPEDSVVAAPEPADATPEDAQPGDLSRPALTVVGSAVESRVTETGSPGEAPHVAEEGNSQQLMCARVRRGRMAVREVVVEVNAGDPDSLRRVLRQVAELIASDVDAHELTAPDSSLELDLLSFAGSHLVMTLLLPPVAALPKTTGNAAGAATA